MSTNLLVFVVVVSVAGLIALRAYLRSSVLRRSALLVESMDPDSGVEAAREEKWLVGWLARAGYRQPAARFVFLAASAASMVLAVIVVLVIKSLGLVDNMVASLEVIPGGLGDVFASIAVMAPYFMLILVALGPTLVVRAARRARVEAIERDLASSLELFATLAEAGLGFDAAVSRIQESEDETLPLAQEFHIYQRDVLGGIPRLEALRRLALRTDVTSVSIFVSALIQAESVGASLAETLRSQADDLRDRRKLRALLMAQALPVKLVFPLMACFLPGIFFATLGPVIARFISVADTVLNRG